MEEKVLPDITMDNRPYYEKWQEAEGLDVIKGMYVEDLKRVTLKPWKRKGGFGVFINLEGAGAENDAYVCEIPPRGSLLPQKHLFEETIFILEGIGATTLWTEGGAKQSFEWQAGSLFSSPLNTWHQHFNGKGDTPVRYLAVTLAPLIMNIFHNNDFIFNNPFPFTDRYDGQKNYFSGEGKLCKAPDYRRATIWETNFISDVLSLDLPDRKDRGAGKSILFELSDNSISAHISEFPSGTYKKAHRHGPGAHVTIVSGEGYTLMWQEGNPIQRYNWKAGSMIVPPEKWFHQHFNVGKEPAKYLALHGRSSRKHKRGGKNWKSDTDVKKGGDQIEYQDEDPKIREMFEYELSKRGIECRMPKI